MTAMSNAPVEPESLQPEPLLPLGREWTVEDLKSLPDDGLRYELLDGMLLVSPAPARAHQRAVSRLFAALSEVCPPELELLVAPVDWQPDRRTSLQPDIVVIPEDDRGEAEVTQPLVLAVEVLSPSTRRKDLLLKRSRYQDGGVRQLWFVDPEEPSITALVLREGRYRVAAEGSGEAEVTLPEPIAVRVTAAGLISR